MNVSQSIEKEEGRKKYRKKERKKERKKRKLRKRGGIFFERGESGIEKFLDGAGWGVFFEDGSSNEDDDQKYKNSTEDISEKFRILGFRKRGVFQKRDKRRVARNAIEESFVRGIVIFVCGGGGGGGGCRWRKRRGGGSRRLRGIELMRGF